MRGKSHKKPPVWICVLVGLVAVLGIGALVMWLWNAILPSVFNVGRVSYWQALGILILSKILFDGLGGPKRHGPPPHVWREKFKQMTEEEREAFKNAWRRRCGRM